MLSHSTITRISLLVWSLMRVDFVCRYDRNAPYRELFEAVEDFELEVYLEDSLETTENA